MSLRHKILVAIAFTMVLVLGLLSVNLIYTARSRAVAERYRIGTLASQVVQEWIHADETLRHGPPDAESWMRLQRRLAGSLLFRAWLIVDSAGAPLTSDPNLGTDLVDELTSHPKLKASYKEHRRYVEGDRVFFPLVLPSNVTLCAMTCDISTLVVPESYVDESIQNVVGIMALGGIMVVLNVFILLNRLVIRPLEQLVDASARVAQGDYSKPVPTDGGRDELTHLVEAFNTMMGGLREYHGTLEAKIDEARDQIKQTQQGLVIAQRLSAMGTLAAGIAHEINNPLGGLMNAARVLKKPDIDPARREQYLELISDGLDRIQETVRKLLQFTPRKTEPQPIQLKEVLRRAVALVQHKLDRRSVYLDDRLPAELPLIFGDASELQQVFVNLIINATDAIEDSTGSIILTHEVRDRELVLCIEDTGCGMNEAEIGRAFDLFFTTKPAGQGTGLGLAVVSNIIGNHGGKIEMKSAKGVGTKVFIVLPILQSVAAASAPSHTAPAESAAPVRT